METDTVHSSGHKNFNKCAICWIIIERKKENIHTPNVLKIILGMYLTFLIILMVIMITRKTPRVLVCSQGYQKSAICQVSTTESQSTHPKSLIPIFYETPCIFGTIPAFNCKQYVIYHQKLICNICCQVRD